MNCKQLNGEPPHLKSYIYILKLKWSLGLTDSVVLYSEISSIFSKPLAAEHATYTPCILLVFLRVSSLLNNLLNKINLKT